MDRDPNDAYYTPDPLAKEIVRVISPFISGTGPSFIIEPSAGEGSFVKAIKDAHENRYPRVIVDGFPRTKEQAEWLADYMEDHKETIDLVVVLEVPEGEIMNRLEKRARMEDTPETIAKRMTIYRQKMYPVLGTFAEEGMRIVHLDGTGTAGEVHDRLYAEIESNGLV